MKRLLLAVCAAIVILPSCKKENVKVEAEAKAEQEEKATVEVEPILNGAIGPQEDWIDIYELRRMIPGDPKIELVRSWLYFHGIPHYKSGRTTLFRRQEIEAWIERSQKYGLGDFWTKKRKYKDGTDVSFTKDQGED